MSAAARASRRGRQVHRADGRQGGQRAVPEDLYRWPLGRPEVIHGDATAIKTFHDTEGMKEVTDDMRREQLRRDRKVHEPGFVAGPPGPTRACRTGRARASGSGSFVNPQ
jgi:hypothetical protein